MTHDFSVLRTAVLELWRRGHLRHLPARPPRRRSAEAPPRLVEQQEGDEVGDISSITLHFISTIWYRFKMADKVDLAKGADSFRLCNPPPFLAALNYASLEVGNRRMGMRTTG